MNEEIKQVLDAGIATLKTQFEAGFISKEDFGKATEALKTESTKQNEATAKKLDNIEEIVKTIQSSSSATISEETKGMLREVIKTNHEAFKTAIKSGKKLELTFKAPAVHMTNNGTVSAGTVATPTSFNVDYDANVAKIRVDANFILNVIPNMQVNKVAEQRIRREEAAKEGDAALTEEGEVKPLIQFKWTMTTTRRKKYAGRVEWTEEFEMDYEALVVAIIDMLEREVVTKWQDGIITEMLANATSYVSSALDGTLTAPDNALAVIAAQLQLQSLNYNPDVVLMNPQDVAVTMFQQNDKGEFMVKPYIDPASGTLNGMKLVTSNKIAKGSFLIGESGTYREFHSNYIMRTGQYGDQLIENEYTVIGEVFSLLSIAQLDLKGWIKGDLAAMKTALLKAGE